MPSYRDSEEYFERWYRFLKLESDAERERLASRRESRKARGMSDRSIEAQGDTLMHMVISDHRTGLGGRTIATFVKRQSQALLPWNRFRVGAPVVASDENTLMDVANGVVCARSSSSVEVVFDDWPEGKFFRLELSADEVTRKRQQTAMLQALQGRGRIAQFRELLIHDKEPQFFPIKNLQTIEASLAKSPLNASQREAIIHALGANDLAIIHGPPGTGKTTTVAELIRQAVAKGQRVLACAPSNTGVDNLLEKLVELGINAIRIGHPARVLESLQEHTLDYLVEADPAMKVIREMRREAEMLTSKAGRWTRAKPMPGAREDLKQEARRLRNDAKIFEEQIIDTKLDRASVICATTNYDPEILGDRTFDLGVIDEACQSTEPGYWPVVLRVEQLVLAGDHCQLPPTVLSTQATLEGLSKSMMERLVERWENRVTRQLTIQYRMHQKIMEFPSEHFYHGTLVADASVAEHTLADLPGIQTESLDAQPVLFVDTSGADWAEELDPNGESKLNPREAIWILKQVDALLAAGLLPDQIAVIAPYSAQVRFLRDRCTSNGVEIDTVDGFQGREKEAVLISLVRSNSQGEVGFLGDTRRMNVAMTRAKRKLIVIGDGSTLGRNAFFKKWIEHTENQGFYKSIWEFNPWEQDP
ncbi:MAG: AAA domain-containing protein [Planctomycetaceae bacterium]|nr:AAA domain-containing protein [Planctomycetaceae bacterium]